MDPEDLNTRVDEASATARAFLQRLRAGETTEGDDPRPELAGSLFALWLAHADVAGSDRALEGAFRLWGRLGSLDEMRRALPRLDPRAAYWGKLVEPIAAACFHAERMSELPALLERLAGEATDPKTLAALHSTLGSYHLRFAREPERARVCYERVLELTSDARSVLWARGALYEIERLQPGQAAPDFSATAVEGKDLTLRALRGRVVLLAFWAAYCGPCRPEIPHLRAVRSALPEAALAVIGVCKDPTLAPCRAAIAEERLDWPQIWEPYPRLGGPLRTAEEYPDHDSIARAYNVWAIPRAYLIGRDGTIVANDLRGARMVEEVQAAVGGA